MSHPFEVDPTYFGALKARTQMLLDNHPESIDSEMLPIIKFIHENYPKLTSVFCCEGHMDIENYREPYIMFAVGEGGSTNLIRAFNLFLDNIKHHASDVRTGVQLHRYSLNMTLRINAFNDHSWKPVMILNTEPIVNKGHRAFIFKHLLAALETCAAI
jgi:hypothetical protein